MAAKDRSLYLIPADGKRYACLSAPGLTWKVQSCYNLTAFREKYFMFSPHVMEF